MQKETLEKRLKEAEKTRNGELHATKAKETPGGVVAMSTCRICKKPAIYTMQSIFVCVPCKYITH